MSREELGERWGHTTLWRGAPAEIFRKGYIPPLRLSKKVCLPLGPLCEGAPPAGGGGENCAVARNILGYGKVLSLRPFGAPPSQREVFRHAEQPTKMGCPGYFCLMGNSIFNVNWFSWVVISAVPPYFSAVS